MAGQITRQLTRRKRNLRGTGVVGASGWYEVSHLFADGGVPLIDRNLAGLDGGPAPKSIVDDFEPIAAVGVGHRGHGQIVEDQELGLGKGLHELRIASVSTSLETDDTDLLLLALGDVARARGIAQVAKDSGLGRESLYKTLAPGAKPRFDTVLKVARALGVRLAARSA